MEMLTPSATMPQGTKEGRKAIAVNRYLPVILLYFFFNTMGLPHGLVYTSVLAPCFYLWLIRKRQRFVISKFLLVISPFAVVQLVNGVVIRDFIVSTALFFTVYIAVYTVGLGGRYINHFDKRLVTIIYLNFSLALVGVALKFTPLTGLMWRENDLISAGIDRMARFKMFVYEPSYYSTLLVPLFLFAYFRCVNSITKKNIFMLFMVTLPLLMSYSFGVISGLLLAVGLVHAVYIRKVLTLNRKKIMLFGVVAVIALVVLLQSSFLQRIGNVTAGLDTSGQARTILSYVFAYEIADQKSLFFGTGLGQPKLIGQEIIAAVNPSWAENDAHLPCAIAETLATFGVFGFLLRIGVQIYLFFRTRAFANYYQLSLFLFIFVYQFTGSFLTNIAEYVIWILAFTPLFPEFDVPAKNALSRFRRSSSTVHME